MADWLDWVKSSDLINKTSDEDWEGIAMVNPTNPVNWGALAKTLVGSFVSMMFMSVYGVVDAVFEIFVGPITAATSWFTEVIASVTAFFQPSYPEWAEDFFDRFAPGLDPADAPDVINVFGREIEIQGSVFGTAVRTTTGALPDLGPFAFPVGVAVMLSGLYVGARGIELLREGL